MTILHIAWLDAMQASGVNVVVPMHVKSQRQFADAALWCVHERPLIEGLEQVFTAKALDDLPAPYDRPDIAVFHGVYTPAFIPIYKQLRRLGIPYVIVPHGALINEAQKKSRLKKIIGNLLLFQPFCTHAAALQCLTEREKRDSVFGGSRFVAPNGIAPQTSVKTAFRTDATRFVFIGRLDIRAKGLDILIAAFGKEKSFLTAGNCRLDLYGPDEDHGKFSAEAVRSMIRKHGADGLVTLHEPVYGDDKTAVLLDADVFIQTSRNEALPTGVLEALSFGVPCLVTEGTSMTDTVRARQAGWCAATATESVANALRCAVRERDSLPQKSRGALAAAEEFRWENAAKTAVQQYQIICGKECDAV